MIIYTSTSFRVFTCYLYYIFRTTNASIASFLFHPQRNIINDDHTLTRPQNQVRKDKCLNSNDIVLKRSFHLFISTKSDVTSLFNADIHRIVSRIQNKKQNDFLTSSSSSSSSQSNNLNSSNNMNTSVQAAEHALRMLTQMISLYQRSNGKTAKPNMETFQLVLDAYSKLGNIKWLLVNNYNGNDGYHIDYTSFQIIKSPFHQYPEKDNTVGSGASNIDDNNYNENDFPLSNEVTPVDRMQHILQLLANLQKESSHHDVDMDNLDITNHDDDSNSSLSLDIHTYLCILKGYARCGKQIILPNDYDDFTPAFSSQIDNTNTFTSNVYMNDFDDEIRLPWDQSILEKSQFTTYAERCEQTWKHMIKHLHPNLITRDSVENQIIFNRENNWTVQQFQSLAYVVEAWSRQQPSFKKVKNYYDGLNDSTEDDYLDKTALVSDYYNTINYSNNDHSFKSIRKNAIQNNDTFVRRATFWLLILEQVFEQSHSILISDTNVKESKINNLTVQDYHERKSFRRLLLWAYSDVLDAWARCGVDGSIHHVNIIFSKIESLCKQDEIEHKLFQETFDIDVDLMSNYDENDDTTEDDRAIESYTVSSDNMPASLRYKLYPSSQTFTSSILALSRSRDEEAPKRADYILKEMLKLYDSGEWGINKPSILAFNAVISAWGHSKQVGHADKAEMTLNLLENLYFDERKSQYNYLKPDVVSYNAAITAWANSKEEAAVINAENLLRRMEDFWKTGDLDVKPDAFTYNACITAWIRSNLGVTSAKKAETLLRIMIDKYQDGDDNVKPNVKIFSAVINAWAKCGDNNLAAERALRLLKYMESLEILEPDVITYTAVIDAIARSSLSDRGSKALSILDKMEKIYEGGNELMKPNVRTYTCVLLAYANSREKGMDLKAKEILERMKLKGVQPNSFTYNYVINCASSVTGSDERRMNAFKVALEAFQNLRNSPHHSTDSYTYAFFLKACNNLLPHTTSRSTIIEKTFIECCNQGKLNDAILLRLVRCLPDGDVRNILNTPIASNIRKVQVSQLPPEWSRGALR